jgi:hypothetical protein
LLKLLEDALLVLLSYAGPGIADLQFEGSVASASCYLDRTIICEFDSIAGQVE